MGSQFLRFSFIIPLKHLNIQGHSFFFLCVGGSLKGIYIIFEKELNWKSFQFDFLQSSSHIVRDCFIACCFSCWFVWLIFFFINIWNGHSSSQVLLTPTHLAIVMEYAAGGELFERICSAGRFSEDEVD